MFSKINNWHLSLLIIIVSVLSLMLIQQRVLAIWQPPTTQPGVGNLDSLLFNPIGEELYLENNAIYNTSSPSGTDNRLDLRSNAPTGLRVSGNPLAGYFDGNVYIDGDLNLSGILPSGYWRGEESTSNIYYYLDDITHVKVGIGTATPSDTLHVINAAGDDSIIRIEASSFSSNANLIIERLNLTRTASVKYKMAGDFEWETGILGVPGFNEYDFSIKNLNPASGGNANILLLPNDGNVGIGTTTPNSLLHVYRSVPGFPNAEIDIQSVEGFEQHWAIYQERLDDPLTSDYDESEDLRFWNFDGAGQGSGTSNILTLTNDGRIGINSSTPRYNTSLTVYNEQGQGGGIRVVSTHDESIGIDVSGGRYGIYSSTSIGIGVYGEGLTGIRGQGSLWAGQFFGNVDISGYLKVGDYITATNDIISTTGNITASTGYFDGLGIGNSLNKGLREVEAKKILDNSVRDGLEVQFPQFDEGINVLTLYADGGDIFLYGSFKGNLDDMWWAATVGSTKQAAALGNIFPTSMVTIYSTNDGDDWTALGSRFTTYNHCDLVINQSRVEVTGLSSILGVTNLYVTIFYKSFPIAGWPCYQSLPDYPPTPI